jgi:hypothetical protein
MSAVETTSRSPADLLAASRKRRASWFELDEPPRRAVQMRRPLDVEMLGFAGRRDSALIVELIGSAAIDWRNFTTADVLGPSQGSDDVAPFSAELFAEWAGDHVLEATQLGKQLIAKVEEHTAALKAEAKNSPTS